MSQEQVATLVARIRAREPERDKTVAEARAEMDAMEHVFPVESDIAVEQVTANGVPAEWSSAPNADPGRVLLYLHGGGYVCGSPASHRSMVGRLARACAARALSVDYRLAPEHPFPAALEDATAAYRWLLAQGVAPERLIIAGDSAGGGLTLAALIALRDAGDPLPAAAVCLSPFTDLAITGPSTTALLDADPLVRKPGPETFAAWYLDGADPRTPLASPLYADLAGLPPLFILVGTEEVLLDDSTRLAERARAAGVEATLEVAEGMIHVWPFFAPVLDEGMATIRQIGEYVRARTG